MSENLTSEQVAELRAAFKRHAQPLSDDDNDEENEESKNNTSGDDDDDDDDDDDSYDDAAAPNGSERREKGFLDRSSFRSAVDEIQFIDEDEGGADFGEEEVDGMFDEADWDGEERVKWEGFVETVGSRFGVEDNEREILRQFKRYADESGSVSRKDFLAVLGALGEDVGSMGSHNDEGGGGGGMGEQAASHDSLDSGANDRIEFRDFAAMYGLSERACQSFETKQQQASKEEFAKSRADRKADKIVQHIDNAMAHFLPLAPSKAALLSEDCCLCLEALCVGAEEQSQKNDSGIDNNDDKSQIVHDEEMKEQRPKQQQQLTVPPQGIVVVFPSSCQHLYHKNCIGEVVRHKLSQKGGAPKLLECVQCRATWDWKAAPPAVSSVSAPAVAVTVDKKGEGEEVR